MALKYLYVPSGYIAGTAYGVLPNVAAADFSFTRDSAGFRVNSDGLLESELSDVPRLDYTDSSCPSLLLEASKTNLVTYSENFTDSDWGKTNSTVTANATIDPQGGNDGFLVSLDTSEAYVNHAVSFLAEPTTFSVYLKSPTVAGTYPLNWYASNGGNHHRELVNVTTEWKRFEINFTPTGLGGRFIYIGDIRGDGAAATLSSVYAWGAQVESSSKATSYIKTEADVITRSADTGIVTSDLSSYINSTEGVLEVKMSRFEGISSAEQSWISLSASETNDDNSVSVGFTNSNATLAHFIKSSDANVTTPTTSQVTEDLSQMNVIKLKWKDGDFKAKIGNTTIDLSAGAGSLPFASTLKYLRIGYPNYSAGAFKGNIQYIKVYDSATDF